MANSLITVIPIVAGIISFVLTLPPMLAGGNPDNANDLWILGLNISGVRQAIVTFGPADTSDPSLDAFADMYPGISNVIGRVLSTYGDEIEDMQRSVLADAKSGIEVVDVSLFYPSKTCRGNYVNQTTFTGPINITSCHGYWDRSVGWLRTKSLIPTGVNIGNTNVAVNILVGVHSTIEGIVEIFAGIMGVTMGLYIMEAVLEALVVLGSLFAILRGRRRAIVLFNLGFSTFACSIYFLTAFWITMLTTIAAEEFIHLGSDFDFGWMGGKTVHAYIWLAWLFSAVVSAFWFMVWLIEIRRRSLSPRFRSEEEMGSWTGIKDELRRDFHFFKARPVPMNNDLSLQSSSEEEKAKFKA